MILNQIHFYAGSNFVYIFFEWALTARSLWSHYIITISLSIPLHHNHVFLSHFNLTTCALSYLGKIMACMTRCEGGSFEMLYYKKNGHAVWLQTDLTSVNNEQVSFVSSINHVFSTYYYVINRSRVFHVFLRHQSATCFPHVVYHVMNKPRFLLLRAPSFCTCWPSKTSRLSKNLSKELQSWAISVNSPN